jgi:C4-dicarboxylate transporter DctM subunit
MIMAGMSGSAVADCTATGSLLIPIMKKDKYPAGFAGALVAAASTIGPIIPPSIPMILIGSIVGISVGRMFIGGAIPGVLMGVALIMFIYIVARKNNMAVEPRASMKEILTATKGAILPMGMPIVILGSIVTGITTPTEAAVLGVWYSLILILFVYRTVKVSELGRLMLQATIATAGILFICAIGILFGWILTSLQLGPKLVNLIFGLTSNPYIILAIINVVLLVMGMFMEAVPIILLMTPILFPLIQKIGVDPVHFGVMMTLNLMLGLLTPPVGLHLFISASIAKVNISEMVKAIMPMLIVLLIVLAIVTYVPQVTLWLPNLIMN